MFAIYVVLSAITMLLLNIPFDIFMSSHSWYSAPLIFVGLIFGYILLAILILFVMTTTVNLNKPPRDTAIFRFFVDMFLKTVFGLFGVKIHTTGLDKVPDDERFLLVCNHIHDFDPAIIYWALPDKRLSFIAKKEVRELYPIVYKILHKLGGLPIDRENNREAAKTVINATKLIKSGTNSVAVFPEGYIKGGELQPIRNGSLKIATKANAKIVVCSLVGTRDIIKNLFKRKTDIYFDVLDVIDTADNAHTVELGDQIHEMMRKSIESHKK